MANLTTKLYYLAFFVIIKVQYQPVEGPEIRYHEHRKSENAKSL